MLRHLRILIAGTCLAVTGCHDGPLYALKHANPFFVHQWNQDEAIGTTDFQRQKELELLVRTMPNESPADQAQWLVHLEQIMQQDASAEMRHLAIRAAAPVQGPAARNLIEMGLEDPSIKVRMAACDVLGSREEPAAAETLARIIGESTNGDVRQAALRGLGQHKGTVVTDSLKLALEDRDPAIRLTAVQSLESVTGKSLGNDPAVWVAYLENGTDPTADQGLSDRLRNLF
ncbi:HEAT repeat domain-containing protein [Roseimaritima multifibrata]|nr:HEAT repeat domain-containing protein [Roseimaritima multifibrata]